MLSRSWLFLTIPVALAAFVLLAWTVGSLLRTVRGSVIATVPIRAEQRVDINSSGDFAINIEGPVLTRIPTSLRFALANTESNARVALYPTVMPTHVTSMSRSRMELQSFTIAAPGTYTLRIDGIDASAGDASHAILITRQYRGALVLHVLALIALGAALIGSLVASGLVLSGTSLAPASLNDTPRGVHST